jgi:hypothetical protein
MLSGAPERKADKIKVTAQDVATQRQAIKNLGTAKKAPAAAAKPVGNGRRKPGRKRGPKPAAAAPRTASSSKSSPVELIDKTLSLAQECGGVGQLKRLVDRLAGM